MDYTEIYNSIRSLIKSQGIDENFIDREETLYYDESGNIKHLIVKENKLNAEKDTVFVLGGVQAENAITIDELKKALGKAPDVELKSTKDLKGSFIEILRKENLKRTLHLIHDKQWHIHFIIVQVLYYGFVDIVDSISGLEADSFTFKAELYKVLNKYPDITLSIFKKYKYPNVSNKDKKSFLTELLTLIDCVINEDTKIGIYNPLLCILRNCVDKAKEQKELTFIQNETTHEWVGDFVQFYRQEILLFYNKTLIFDEEKQVMKALESEEIEINNRKASNFCFKESTFDPMIQICDYVVCILRKYLMFLDRLETEVNADILCFDEIQMSNFMLLNSVLADSLNYNPLFVHFIASQHTIAKYHKYISIYGYDHDYM